MLEQIIEYLRAAIAVSLPSANVSGLAEKIEREGRVFPALYCTKDEYKQPMHNEAYAYFRQRGSMSETQSDDESVSGCDDFIVRTYPLTLVAYLPKNILESDDKYIDSKLVNNLSNIITLLNWGSVIQAAKLDYIRAQVRSAETDRYAVWRREYTGVEMAARFDHVLVSIDFDVQIQATERCLRNFVCGEQVVIPKLCEDAIIENSDQTFVQAVPSGDTFVLPDEQYEVYVDGVLVGSGSFPVYGNQQIIINA